MDQGLPLDTLAKGAADLISAGFLGTAVVALAFVIIYLWREMKARHNQYYADIEEERERHSAEMVEERRKHNIEIAEQRKLNGELQEARLNELKAALQEISKAIGTVEAALAFMHGGAK